MRPTEITERAKIIKQNGKKILSMNFSNLQTEQTFQVIDYSTKLLQKMPEKSIFTLTNVTGADFNLQMIETLKKFSSANSPYVIAGAVVGAEGVRRTVFNSVLIFSGRKNLKLFSTEDEAKTWLLAQ